MSRIFTVDFTKNYIEELAAYLDRGYISAGKPLDRAAIVFGGRRPALFLKRALAARIKGPFIPPKFYTIDELMDELADVSGRREVLSPIEECHELFTLARELTPELLEGRASFAAFMPWAAEILDFIGELDLEDVSPGALKNIEASARIGYPVPDSINRLLEKVLTLRGAFHRRLAGSGRTRRSLQYLRAKENVAGAMPAYDEIVFANFFYFHRTEEVVAKALYSAGKATLIFQGDQRKWPVLERIARRFECTLYEGERPTPTTFRLDACCAFDVHSEAAMARDILLSGGDPSSTVIIVPDSNALIPLLSAFPSSMDDFNVSMGYSVKRGSLYALLQAVFRAQISRRDGLYYSRDYISVLRHPLIRGLTLSAATPVLDIILPVVEQALKGRLISAVSGRLFIALDEIASDPSVSAEARRVLAARGTAVSEAEVSSMLAQWHDLFFTPWGDLSSLSGFARALEIFLDTMKASSAMASYPLNTNIAIKLDEIRDMFARASLAGEVFTIEDCVKVFEAVAGRAMASFSGTPLKGLQVLGLFETRSLNFNTVIVMDTNEGVLPKVEARASLIPREVMSQLGIDRLELEEEIQRYQFMRVIASAANVHVIYQQNKEKEPSRFLEELIWEQQVRAGELKAFPTRKAVFQTGVSARRRFAPKTPRIMEFLGNMTWSASGVNAYLRNPYGFYLRYVLGVREQDDSLDEPDAVLVGNFWHHFLEAVYRPFEGRKPVWDDAFEAHINGLFERFFRVEFASRMRSGDFLVRKVLEHRLKMFVAFEQERWAHVQRLVALEKDYSAVLELPSGRYTFKARVDRVEEHASGVIAVLDYKTGSADRLPARPLRLSAAPCRREIFEKVHSFQLPLYMHCVSRALPGASVNAGLFYLRSAEIQYFFTDKFPLAAPDEALRPYWQALDAVMLEIMDPEVPFVDDDLSNFAV
jgi:hypothetical protein